MKIPMSEMSPLLEELLKNGNKVRLTVSGMSMFPLLVSERDSVELSPCSDHIFKKGDIPFYKRDNGTYVMHRILKVDNDGNFYIAGDNQLVIEYPVKRESCFAYVSAIYRKDKYYLPTSFGMKTYTFFWVNFFRLRPLMIKGATMFSHFVKKLRK